ncbi:DinB family protein [Heyndrickxia oleronia]|uniref:DinB family protein n=1 Tax=Heyndrickxia oleronia TaxID=38875 RepID=UPI00203B0B81|nr:DinB family protein [Heyndrickxia oleronia]MCM3456253.1 DinB family protein [Heyndrickxia oleronia]
MDVIQRKEWNANHKKLTEIILKSEEHSQAIQLFLSQHALLHSSSVGNSGNPTLEDEVLIDLEEKLYREYPVANRDTKNSIVWHLWHIARIEDMTMNILIANDEQVSVKGNWTEKMNIGFCHSGNDMSDEEITELSKSIDFDSLIAYRQAVGRRTRDIISLLDPGQFNEKVNKNRINRLFDENAVTQESAWLADYWSKKTIAGLILMPATRHNYLHLNKCIRIKEKIQKRMKKSKGY